MRILITFETNVSQVSRHKHRISISVLKIFADFLRGIPARRSRSFHNPRVTGSIALPVVSYKQTNDFYIFYTCLILCSIRLFSSGFSNPKVWYVRCQKYLLLSKDIHDLLQRRFEPLRNCHRIKDPCKALTTFFKAFRHTFFHAFFKTFLTAIQVTALPI